jgi:hypothetical protein
VSTIRTVVELYGHSVELLCWQRWVLVITFSNASCCGCAVTNTKCAPIVVQDLGGRRIDGLDSIDDWIIDGNYCVVCYVEVVLFWELIGVCFEGFFTATN